MFREQTNQRRGILKAGAPPDELIISHDWHNLCAPALLTTKPSNDGAFH